MRGFGLTRHSGLHDSTRLRYLTSDDAQPRLCEWLLLFSAGAAAALASTMLDMRLRIPGHAILRVVFPMAIGLAMVPRRGAGTVMGTSAILTAVGLRLGGLGGAGLSLGAFTSLAATGPLLDGALRRTRGGWRLYGAFAAAGLASNLLALVVRGTAKAVGWEHAGARPLAAWLPQAAVSYVVCGLLAGLISGAVWFYAGRTEKATTEAES